MKEPGYRVNGGFIRLEFEPMSFSSTSLGPFWEDDVFGSQIKPLQLTIVIFPKQFEEFGFYF